MGERSIQYVVDPIEIRGSFLLFSNIPISP